MLFIENFVSVTGLELIASKIISLFFLNCEQLDTIIMEILDIQK